MSVLYEDRHLVCDEDAITVRQYYFPVGQIRIPYAEIRGLEERSLGAWTGKWRIWGTGDFEHWYHFDVDRPRKDKSIVLDKGGWVRAVITPDDPDAVLRILREKTGKG
ncbi:MAG: PH domain-containing protein [Myxococcaceae bacterium]